MFAPWFLCIKVFLKSTIVKSQNFKQNYCHLNVNKKFFFVSFEKGGGNWELAMLP